MASSVAAPASNQHSADVEFRVGPLAGRVIQMGTIDIRREELNGRTIHFHGWEFEGADGSRGWMDNATITQGTISPIRIFGFSIEELQRMSEMRQHLIADFYRALDETIEKTVTPASAVRKPQPRYGWHG